MAAIPLALHLIFDAKALQLFECGARGIGRVCIQCYLIAQQKRITFGAIMGVSRRDGLGVDEAVLIHVGFDRIAVGGFHVATAISLDVPACLEVALGLASYAFSGP